MANRANRTILVVDDNPNILAYFFNLFEAGDAGALDILGEATPSAFRWHPTIRHLDPLRFDRTFESMVHDGRRFPLCLLDLRFFEETTNTMDNRRGLATARLVRALDPHIHIVLYTHLPDVDGSELVAVVGGSTHFFRMPFREGEELQFCGKVRELIDDWNSGL